MSLELAHPCLSKLVSNDPDVFAALWESKASWIEPPNERRGGWSGATRLKIRDGNGAESPCILKKQENHGYHSIRTAWLPRPTFEREAKNLRFLQEAGVPVPEILYYGRRKTRGHDQAVLLVSELTNYRSLEDILDHPSRAEFEKRRAIAQALGSVVGVLHNEVRWQHRNLYPKHLFLKMNENGVEVCMIDLENAGPLRKRQEGIQDLKRLLRRTPQATAFDQLAFVKAYCRSGQLEQDHRSLIEKIMAN